MRPLLLFLTFVIAVSARITIKAPADGAATRPHGSKFIITTPPPTPSPTAVPVPPCIAAGLGCEIGKPCSDHNPCTALDTCLPTEGGNVCVGRSPRRCPPIPNDCYEEPVWEPNFDLSECRCRFAFKPASTSCGVDRVCNGQGACIWPHSGVETESSEESAGHRHHRHRHEHSEEPGEESSEESFEHGEESSEGGEESSEHCEGAEHSESGCGRERQHHHGGEIHVHYANYDFNQDENSESA